MPLHLHKALKERLITILAEALPLMEIENNKFFTVRSRFHLFRANAALPEHGSLHKKLLEFVDDFPLITFGHDFVADELLRRDYESGSQLTKLTQIEEYKDARALASRLIESFDSLPWQYTLTVQLPDDVSTLLAPIIASEKTLSKNISLVKATEEFSKRFPIDSTDAKKQRRIHGGPLLLIGKPQENKWSEGAIYLQIRASGFIGPYGGTSPALQAERWLKAFLGLGMALKLFRISPTYISPPTELVFYVHKAHDEDWAIETKLKVDSDVSHVIHSIKPHNVIMGAETDEKRQGFAELILQEMAAVFSAGAEAQAITLAGEWLFGSHSGRDERLNYVQAMVVLEVLLGDKATSDEIGLGQLLRNRCAYLIGTDHQERTSLLKDFDDIYRVRSQIVHRGMPQLSIRERVLFQKLHDICRRVIQREVDLLRAAKSN